MKFSKVSAVRIISVILFIITIPVISESQEIKPEYIAVDYTDFIYQKEYSVVEVYFSINRDISLFKPVENGFIQKMRIFIQLYKDESLIMSDTVDVEDFARQISDIKPSQKMLDVRKYTVRAGDYVLKTTFMDAASKNSRTISKKMDLTGFAGEEMKLSGILLANDIKKASGDPSVFDRNSLRVHPNPSSVYGKGLPLLKYYAEIYNMPFSEELKSQPYIVRSFVLGKDGKIVKTLPEKTKKRAGASLIVFDGFNVMGLKDGEYDLKVEVFDPVTEKTAVRLKSFYNAKGPKLRKEDVQVTSSNRYDIMPMDQINKEFDFAVYIAKKNERKMYEQLDEQGRRQFMKRFWEKKDKGCTDRGEAYRAEYFSRVSQVNQLYSRQKKQGWKTDRGRIFIKYGKPDQVENNMASSDKNAYQVWYYYNLYGGIEFFFVDRFDIRKYDLVHSTHRKELQDYKWQRWLTK